jgi:trimeric autotransporter adhesin
MLHSKAIPRAKPTLQSGVSALVDNTTGSDNIALGFGAGDNVTTASDVICIGAGGANVSNSCFIGQIFDATSSAGIAVFINSSGRLGTTTSSQRFKQDIEPMAKTSEALFALKPVTFRYKKAIDPQGTAQFGLVAEDVEAVNPDLVVRDKGGKAHSVRYDQVNAILLNEFLKEHKAFLEEQRKGLEQAASIAALNATVTEQQKGIQVLATQLKEQAAQIQKVSAQLEASKPAPQIVNNNQ